MSKPMNVLTVIPGIGKSIAQDLHGIGIYHAGELKGKHPEHLYEKLCKRQEVKLDRCVLYVLRCAVYFASNTLHDPELSKWWNWKDNTYANTATQGFNEDRSICAGH